MQGYVTRPRLGALLLVGAMAAPLPARSADPDWIGTWAASPQPIWDADFFAPLNIPRSMREQTVRQIAHVSIGGSRIRVVLSNEYGNRPLVIGAAHIALASEGSSVVGGSDRVLTFGGRASFTIPPGAPAVSDPADLAVAPLGNVAVSLYLPEITPLTTFHWEGVQTGYIGAGDQTGTNDIKSTETIKPRVFVSEIQVNAPSNARAVVTFGDSITDGADSTPDANHRWPDFLAERLQRSGNTQVAVLNEGISGARVLRDRMGVNALARFDRDVLDHAHADTVVLMMGINDIGWPGTLLVPKGEPAPSAEDVIWGYQQLITRAHAHGMRIIGATLTPFEDTFHGTRFTAITTRKKKRSARRLISGSVAAAHLMASSTLTRPPATPRTRSTFAPTMTLAITSIRRTPDTKRWLIRSISAF